MGKEVHVTLYSLGDWGRGYFVIYMQEADIQTAAQ